MTKPMAAQLALAPLGAGDLIDRTIRLYRQHFMALIRASIPPVLLLALGSVLWGISVRALPLTQSGAWLALYAAMAGTGLALTVLSYMLHFIVMGGASHNLVRNLLWDEPVSARAIYRRVRERFWGLVGATIAVFLCVMVAGGVAFGVVMIFLVLVSFFITLLATTLFATPLNGSFAWALVVGGTISVLAATFLALWLFFLLAGRVAYVPQVMLVEGKSIFVAIARSATLARGNALRLMAMYLFTLFGVFSVLWLLLMPLGWYGYLHGIDPFAMSEEAPVWYEIGWQVMLQASTILLTPVWMLGLSLLYVDERVRHEGYDIELLAARVFGEMPALPAGYLSPLTPAIVNAGREPSNTSTATPLVAPGPTNGKVKGAVLGLTER